MDAQQMIMSIFVLARSNEESKRKSERLTAVAEQQRQRARNGEVITARAPGWLEARKGEKIKVIRHHAKTLKEIFSLALKGYGAVRICDYLLFKNRPCWTYTRWSPHYVSQLLRSRLPLGEMQPGRCPRGCKRVVEGEPIKDYYPRIIDEETWNRVQLIRSKSFGRGKVEVGKIKGRGGRSNWKNLFLGLLRDQDGNTVIYKQIQDNWAYLISNDRAKFKTHKVRYLPFQRAILMLLNDIDYASLINPNHQ